MKRIMYFRDTKKQLKLQIRKFVRITGDCPLIDVEMLDKMVEHLIDEDLEYYSNCEVPTYADGLDIEVFKKDLLLEANENAISTSTRNM